MSTAAPIVCRPLGSIPLAEIPGVPATIAAALAGHGVKTLADLDLVADRVRAKNPGSYLPGVGNSVVYAAMRSLGIEGAEMLKAGDAIMDELFVSPIPRGGAKLDAAAYNSQIAELKNVDRYWADDARQAKARALWGGECNHAGVITKPQSQTVERVGQTEAVVHLAASPHGLWLSSCTFRSPACGHSGLPSVWNRAYDTREAARAAAIEELVSIGQRSIDRTASKASQQQTARLVERLREMVYPQRGCGAGSAPTTLPTKPMTTPNLKPRDMPTAALSLHDQHALVPEMSPDQFKEFAADVKARGVQKPIELIPGTKVIIDGRTRWRAAEKAGLPSVPVVDADLGDESPVAYMIRVAYLRRQLTTGQRAALGVELKRQLAKDARERKKAGAAKGAAASAEKRTAPPVKLPVAVPEGSPPAKKDRKGEAREQAAAAVGVSAKTISTAERVAAKSPEAFEQVKAGTLSLGDAARQAGIVKPKNKPPEKPPTRPGLDEICGTLHDLNPCPFCGAVSTWLRYDDHRIICNCCNAMGPNAAGEVKARAEWNRRPKKDT